MTGISAAFLAKSYACVHPDEVPQVSRFLGGFYPLTLLHPLMVPAVLHVGTRMLDGLSPTVGG